MSIYRTTLLISGFQLCIHLLVHVFVAYIGNTIEATTKDLQKELYEARSYHINLHVEYTQLKNAYERLVNVTEEEWRAVENLGLTEPVNKVISRFWEDIEFITTAFFDILELLNRKDYLEKSILAIWRSQLVQFKDKEPAQPEEVPPSSEDGIAVVPGYLEYLNSQLIELKGRIKWVEYNLMKYKFAASHGTELKSIIENVLKGPKKHSKWQMFSRSSSKHSKKLEEEVEWYRKRLKFFREDVQRIKSVQQAIFLKYVTPEDQKRFPSRTHTLENALKGNPTNYPGSWIETSRHSGLSMNPSLQSNPSVQTNPSHSSGALPWTTSLPGAARLEVQCASSLHQSTVSPVGIVESAVSEQSHNAMDRPFAICPFPQKTKDKEPSNHCETANEASTTQLPACSKQESYSKVDIVINRHSSMPDFDRCQGDISKTDMSKTHSAQDFVYRERCVESRNIENCVQSNECNLEGQKFDSEVAKASSNPFEEDDQVDGSIEDNSNEVNKTVHALESAGPQSGKDPTIQSSTRSSSYESADESRTAEPGKAPLKVASSQMPSTSRVSQYSSMNHLASGVYLPCSIPYSGTSATSDIPTLSAGYPIPFPHISYGMFPQSYKPERSIMKKLTSFLHSKKK